MVLSSGVEKYVSSETGWQQYQHYYNKNYMCILVHISIIDKNFRKLVYDHMTCLLDAFIHFILMCMHVCLCEFWGTMCISVPIEERGLEVPWNWSCRQVWVRWHGCWQVKASPLKEHRVLLSIELFLQPITCTFWVTEYFS